MARIVVGVDASPPSVEALRRAVQEAAWRDATLEVVHVVDPPTQMAAFPVPVDRGTDRVDPDQHRQQAEEQLGRWLEEIDVDLRDLDVQRTVVADHKPSRALIERSAGAELVVVGSRGRGGFAGLRLGSVSEQVTRHAGAPVLVVRDTTTDG